MYYVLSLKNTDLNMGSNVSTRFIGNLSETIQIGLMVTPNSKDFRYTVMLV